MIAGTDFPFYTSTVLFMKKVLQNMEKDIHSQQWVYEVSQNIQLLQEGGSFTNALIKRFDKALIPLFLQIITFLDKNSNLALLLFPAVSNENVEDSLWMTIYSSQSLCQNSLVNTIKSNISAPVEAFQCRFPFSWIIFDYINDKLAENEGEHN